MSRLSISHLILILPSLVMLHRCCPEPLQADGQSIATDGDGAPTTSIRLSQLQESFFDRHCALDCHKSAGAAANLQLTSGQSHANLVNRRSQQLASRQRVVPGQPDQSYLIKKLEGTKGIVGNQMPRQAPRPQSEIDQVRSWINRGALDD